MGFRFVVLKRLLETSPLTAVLIAVQSREAKLKEIFDMRTAATPVVDSKMETTTQAEPDLAAKVAALERRNQELSARLAAMEEEDELGRPSDTGSLA